MSYTHTLPVLVVGVLVILALWILAWQAVRLAFRLLYRLPAEIAGTRAWRHARTVRSRLAERHPRTIATLSARIDPHRFAGLPLTLLAAAALYVGFLLGGLVEELLEAEEILVIDRGINQAFQPVRAEPLLTFFTWFTTFGDSAALIAVVVVASGCFWAYRRPLLILPLWVTVVGALTTTWAGKFAFARERPEFLTAVTEASPSFPSGHATGAMAVYGFMAYAIARDLPTLRARFEVTYWMAIVIVLVGLSRIYLAVHYASDVAAGFMVGGFWLLIGFAIAENARAWRGPSFGTEGEAEDVAKAERRAAGD